MTLQALNASKTADKRNSKIWGNMDQKMARNLQPNAYESMAGTLIAYTIVFVLLDIVIVALRFYVRLRVIRNVGLDDWALVATLGSTVGSVIGITYATRLGLGSHIEILSMDQASGLLKLIFVSSLGYHITIMVLKTTFLLQFRRVFPLPVFQRLCDIFMAFLAVWTVVGLVVGATICLPLQKNWDPREPVWTCERRYWFWMAHGIIHVITDVLIFIMPLPLLKTLPLPRLHKIVLIGVFSLGFFTCAISAIRLTTLYASLQDRDISWTSAKTVFWSIGEVTCSIVCLCIPTLRPLLTKWRSPRPGGDNSRERRIRLSEFNVISDPSTESSSIAVPEGAAVPTNYRAIQLNSV